MALYDYECAAGHTSEHKFDIGTAPTEAECLYGEFASDCTEKAKRLLSMGTSFMINKVMSAPSKRLKPGHIGR